MAITSRKLEQVEAEVQLKPESTLDPNTRRIDRANLVREVRKAISNLLSDTAELPDIFNGLILRIYA